MMPFSSKSPQSMIGTFGFVLFMTMIKEAFEDYNRYKQDKAANNRVCRMYNYETKEFEERKWKEIRQGSLLKVNKNEQFPVDLFLVTSSNPDGVVFVDTANLDGETNLKDKNVPFLGSGIDFATSLKGKLFCDKANPQLEEWDGEVVSSSLQKN